MLPMGVWNRCITMIGFRVIAKLGAGFGGMVSKRVAIVSVDKRVDRKIDGEISVMKQQDAKDRGCEGNG